MRYLDIIKLKYGDVKVHVRYGKDEDQNLNFKQFLYKSRIDDIATHINITFWIKKSGNYAAIDTDKLIEKLAHHGLSEDKYVSVEKDAEGFYATKKEFDNVIRINDCILGYKDGTIINSKHKIPGLAVLLHVTKKYVEQKNQSIALFRSLDLKESPEVNRVNNTRIFEIKDSVYDQSELTDYSVGFDYLKRKQLEDKIEQEIEISNIAETDKEQIIIARSGQGKFRNLLLELCERENSKHCLITGIKTEKLLIASHIKPWRDSDNNERLDPHNGLLLSATYDKLFDQGYITFDQNGKLQISDDLSATDRKILFPIESMQYKFTLETLKYLQYHLNNIFRDRSDS